MSLPLLSLTPNQLYGRRRDMMPVKGDRFGVELEMEGVPNLGLMPAVPGWTLKRDDSLREGAEYVTDPSTRPEIGTLLKNLKDVFKLNKFTPVFSYRTSMHVHVNATDMTVNQLLTMYCIYLIVEEAFIAFGGEERRGNVHCLPAKDATRTVEMLRVIFSEQNQLPQNQHFDPGLAFSQTVTNNNNRYASFNWASLRTKNTIEFRSHRGTIDTTEIETWVAMIGSLKSAAMGIFNNPRDVVEKFSQWGPFIFVNNVFGELAPNFVGFTMAKHRDTLWEGVRLAQEIAYCRMDWSVHQKKETAEVLIDGEPPVDWIDANPNVIREGAEIRLAPWRAIDIPAPRIPRWAVRDDFING